MFYEQGFGSPDLQPSSGSLDDLIKAQGVFSVQRQLLDHLQRAAVTDPNFTRRYFKLFEQRAPDFLALLLEGQRQRADPLPPISEITAAQVTIWDNWRHTGGRKPSRKKGEKGAREERFKATVEVWTVGGDLKLRPTNRAFVGKAHLMDGPTLGAKLVELESPKKTLRPFRQLDADDVEGGDWQSYRDFLQGYADDPDGLRVGPLFTVSGGTHFHLGQWATVTEAPLLDRDDENIVVSIRSLADRLDFTNFVSTTSLGKPLEGNALLTSRLDLTGRSDLARWRTCGPLHGGNLDEGEGADLT